VLHGCAKNYRALPAQNDEGLPRGLPRLIVTLPPRGHGRGVTIQLPVQSGFGRGRLAAWIAFGVGLGPGRRATPAGLMEALQGWPFSQLKVRSICSVLLRLRFDKRFQSVYVDARSFSTLFNGIVYF